MNWVATSLSKLIIHIFFFKALSECSYSAVPGNCATKDSVPVDSDMKWQDHCKDIQGCTFNNT